MLKHRGRHFLLGASDYTTICLSRGIAPVLAPARSAHQRCTAQRTVLARVGASAYLDPLQRTAAVGAGGRVFDELALDHRIVLALVQALCALVRGGVVFPFNHLEPGQSAADCCPRLLQ
jgi:hypothetical protein